METYRQMRERHQKEFNEFPCFFAISENQFNRGMEQLGVKSVDELYRGIGGMFYRKTDAPKLHEIIDRSHKELQDALHNDMDFLYKAVYCELADHEACFTEEFDEAFNALGLEMEEVRNDKAMSEVCIKAMADYMANWE